VPGPHSSCGGHRDKIGIALGKHPLGNLRRVDTVAGAQRNRQLALELACHPGESRPWNRSGDRRYARLVPAYSRVDDARTHTLDGLGKLHDFIPSLAFGDEIDDREPIDDDEVVTDRLAYPRHDLDGQAHPIVEASAPSVGTTIGCGYQEFIDEIALGTHHLDAVVSGFARQRRATHEGADLSLHTARAQGARREWRDR